MIVLGSLRYLSKNELLRLSIKMGGILWSLKSKMAAIDQGKKSKYSPIPSTGLSVDFFFLMYLGRI